MEFRSSIADIKYSKAFRFDYLIRSAPALPAILNGFETNMHIIEMLRLHKFVFLKIAHLWSVFPLMIDNMCNIDHAKLLVVHRMNDKREFNTKIPTRKSPHCTPSGLGWYVRPR
jgi:hypothetical protein